MRKEGFWSQMNVVDYVIIGLIGLSVLFGIYRGFVSSVLNTGGCLISFALSFCFIQGGGGNPEQSGAGAHADALPTDASSRIGDLELAISNVRS